MANTEPPTVQARAEKHEAAEAVLKNLLAITNEVKTLAESFDQNDMEHARGRALDAIDSITNSIRWGF